jgi:hypothetical protein
MSDHRAAGRQAPVKMRTSEPRDRAPWTLAASVPQAGIDYDAWSRHRGAQLKAANKDGNALDGTVNRHWAR